MHGIPNKPNNCPTQTTEVSEPNSIQTFKEESERVIQAGREVDRALLMLVDEKFEEAVAIFESINEIACNNCNASDEAKIKNKIFEVGLEISLTGLTEIAKKVLLIADSPSSPRVRKKDADCHRAAEICRHVLCPSYNELDTMLLESALEFAISRTKDLKCAAYFFGNAYKQGLYGLKQDDIKAQKYFQIAAERGYVPGKVDPLKNQREEHQLMCKAQQSDDSVFADLPMELINNIARLRFEASPAYTKPD